VTEQLRLASALEVGVDFVWGLPVTGGEVTGTG
jgi:hypothetical protein